MSRRGNGEGSLSQRADGRWEASMFRTTESGNRRRVRAYGKTRTEAHDKLLSALRDAADGVVVPDKAWRLGAYLDQWLPTIKLRCHPMTYLGYESICRVHLKPQLGDVSLAKLTAPRLQRFFDSYGSEHSARTLQKVRTVLSSALTHAWRQQLLTINPARRVVLPTYRRQDITPWTTGQLQRFLAAARQDPLYPALLLLATYGLRQGEVLGMRWEDIDFDLGVIRVRQQVQRFDGRIQATDLKTYASRRDLPLVQEVREVLGKLRLERPEIAVEAGLIFVTRFDNPLEPGNLTRSFHRLSAQAGLPRIKLHHLRHTAATLLKDLGVPARDVQLILGHSSIATTQQLYQHADLSGQIDALTKLERTLRGPAATHCRQLVPQRQAAEPRVVHGDSGGSSQTRTGDTRLFRMPRDPGKGTLTEVKLLARARYLTAILGGAAVMLCRQWA